MSKDIFHQMDLDHDDYITRDEHLKLKGKWTGEEYALTGLDTMDTNHNGKVIPVVKVAVEDIVRF